MSHRPNIHLEKLNKTRHPQYGWQNIQPRFESGTFTTQVNVTLSLYRPGKAPRAQVLISVTCGVDPGS
jgi:uncharacterized protein (DUF2132 family)